MVMPKIINCQTNIAIRGRMAAELAVLAQEGSWTKVSLDRAQHSHLLSPS